jgi:microcystin-dependent protein
MHKISTLGGALAAALLSTSALADWTYTNYQPSLVVTEVLPNQGIFPSFGGGGVARGDTLGFVYAFAGNFAPGTSLVANGQSASIGANIPLFSLLGTTYGGNGVNTFAVPDLGGRALVGSGSGPGLTPQTLGQASGGQTISLNNLNLPGEGALPFGNKQPSLALAPMIAVAGVFPSGGGSLGSSGPASFLGQISYFAGSVGSNAPGGWLPADGRLLAINQNQALFAILGATYGGNGQTTFALPDLRGRTAVGVGNGVTLGEVFGQESTQLAVNNLPGQGGQPVNDIGPSLGLHYIIATGGVFPPRDSGAGFDQNTATLGEISLFAGDYAPTGWTFADGQVLSIAQNTALFSILGTQYGGDGKSTFALPNLDGRTIIGAGGAFNVGDTIGINSFLFPAPAPAPGTGLLAFCFLSAAWALGRLRMS